MTPDEPQHPPERKELKPALLPGLLWGLEGGGSSALSVLSLVSSSTSTVATKAASPTTKHHLIVKPPACLTAASSTWGRLFLTGCGRRPARDRRQARGCGTPLNWVTLIPTGEPRRGKGE